ncbi:MAG: cytochrome b N-terminal domain-containing protein [Bryobacterales bacterium]|nr:cytochrome b N-terminal domain-containing protein [Bryobacterales bacterium]
MILTAFVHMFSVVFLHAYRRPCEVTWLSGIALLGLSLAFGFSGYLLPWNEISYLATKVGSGLCFRCGRRAGGGRSAPGL